MLFELLLLTACRLPPVAEPDRLEIRFRPQSEGLSAETAWLTGRVPSGQADRGLNRAVESLCAAARDRRARISPEAASRALVLSGYPAPARFIKDLNGGAWPEDMAEALVQQALSSEHPSDVALCRRDYGDDTTLWIAGFAPRAVDLDPLPATLPLDHAVPVRVAHRDRGEGDLTLFVHSPGGLIEQRPLQEELAEWIDLFHVPGEYRVEVVGSRGRESEILLLWSFFVEDELPEMPPLSPPSQRAPNPMMATESLYDALNTLRRETGLPPLERFTRFEPLVREHAALMSLGEDIGHRLEGVSEGVAARAQQSFFPLADHREDVAVAYSWEEAMELVKLSPGHLQNLLCTDCTHASIGVALEPALDRPPRLYVVWELMSFPEGEPHPIENFER